MFVALVQVAPLSPTDARLKQYFKNCKKQKVDIVAFGEYVFMPFFRDICKDSQKDMQNLRKMCEKILKALHKLSITYKLDIIAPLCVCEDSHIYKSIALIQGEKVRFYQQQRLINYTHWNESAFFDNVSPKVLKTPLIFDKNDIKCAIIAGFEIHFDEIWLKLKKSQVDVVIMPCANTFHSKKRWQTLCKARAFNNSVAILRINRIGEILVDNTQWHFYGDSCLINANGEIEDTLDKREGLMLIELQKSQIESIRTEWGFR